MKRLAIMIMASLFCTAAVAAEKVTMAVYVKANEPEMSKLAVSLRERLNTAINNSGDYAVVARSQEIWDALDSEHILQIVNERVRDEDIVEAFSAAGAKIACVVVIRKNHFGKYDLSAQILDIETKVYLPGRSVVVESPLSNSDEFNKAVLEISDGLDLFRSDRLKRDEARKQAERKEKLRKNRQILKESEYDAKRQQR